MWYGLVELVVSYFINPWKYCVANELGHHLVSFFSPLYSFSLAIDPHKIVHQPHLTAVQVTLVANEHDDLSTIGTHGYPLLVMGPTVHMLMSSPKTTELLAAGQILPVSN